MPKTPWPEVYKLLARTLHKLKLSQSLVAGETLYRQLTAEPEFVARTKWLQKLSGKEKPSVDFKSSDSRLLTFNFDLPSDPAGDGTLRDKALFINMLGHQI